MSIPANLGPVTAIAAGPWYSGAIKADGTIRFWGRNDSGQSNAPVSVTRASMIACGGTHAVAIHTVVPPCPADLDTTGVVDSADIAILLLRFGRSGIGDLDADGEVSAADISVVLLAFGTCPD
jgi:hypothetical protein